MLNIFSKPQKILFGSILFISLILLVYSYLRPTPLEPLNNLSEIVPGNTIKSQLSNLPTYHSKLEEGQEKLFFGQNAPQKYSEAIVKNDLVVAYKKTDPNTFQFKKFSDYSTKYGQFQFTVTTSYSEFGYAGYVFLESGLVIVAHEGSSEVVEEWQIPKDASIELIESLFPFSITEEEGH